MKFKLNKKILNNFRHSDKAFVSMIALLLANIFLAIGLSLFGIVLRQNLISSGSANSLLAFSAADGGMECAFYWDLNQQVFSTSTPSVDTINCIGQNISIVFEQDSCGSGCSRNSFEINFPPAGDYPVGSCAQVEILKLADGSTKIFSFGQNTCDVNAKNRVERAWQVTY